MAAFAGPNGQTMLVRDHEINLDVGPRGFAVACTDGEDSQWLVGIMDDGRVFPFGFNALNDTEFAARPPRRFQTTMR